MSITYKWAVSQLLRSQEPEADTVKTVEAYLYGEDDKGYSQTQVFTVVLNLPESYESGTFIEFDDLTESQVIGWIKSVLGVDQERIKKLVSDKITEHYKFTASPPVMNKPAVPW